LTEVGRNTRTTPSLPALPVNPTPVDRIPSAFAARQDPAASPAPKRKSSLLNIAVMALVVPGLFATVALPAYAFAPVDDPAGAEAAVELMELKADGAQSVNVAADATASALTRDEYTTTSAAEMLRAELAAAYASYSGPGVSDFLANPPYPNFDLAAVANVALQYQGAPYVFGGSDPSGFDCSGFVMFVYAQFGIALPHSVTGTAAMGTAIATEAALPGDIVILPGHNGIYLGDGMFIDAPYEGKPVQVRPIYDSNYYIVRIGI
jgi:cell wall-associated NlpC family hydrolase